MLFRSASSTAFADNATTGPDFVNASATAKGSIEPQDTIAFAHDQADPNDVGLDQIDIAARWLVRHPTHAVVLEGHADASGNIPYNDELAMRRVTAVRERLLERGVASDRIILINFGEREARELGSPVHGADRRVVIYATKLAPEQVVGMTRARRPAIAAVWTHGGTLVRVDEGLTRLSTVIVARR